MSVTWECQVPFLTLWRPEHSCCLLSVSRGGTGLIYFRLVQADALQRLNPTVDTTIGFPPELTAANAACAGAFVTISINTLDGSAATTAGAVTGSAWHPC